MVLRDFFLCTYVKASTPRKGIKSVPDTSFFSRTHGKERYKSQGERTESNVLEIGLRYIF